MGLPLESEDHAGIISRSSGGYGRHAISLKLVSLRCGVGFPQATKGFVQVLAEGQLPPYIDGWEMAFLPQ